MKIIRIIVELFAFKYAGEQLNEYDRLMDLWTDVGYLHAFAKKNNVPDVYAFVEDLLQNAEEIQDFLERLNNNRQPLGFYFEPLQASEKGKVLSLQKGKIKRNRLRYYAIKLDERNFVITGGAIKMSQKMDEHPDTAKELVKLKEAKKYLQGQGVFDECSFFELLSEDEED